KAAFEQRSKFIYQALKSVEGVRIFPPQGAFYAFPNIEAFLGIQVGSHSIQTDEDLCMYLLHEAHVATVAGSAFGEGTSLRISFANSMENLEIAMDRMRKALGSITAS